MKREPLLRNFYGDARCKPFLAKMGLAD